MVNEKLVKAILLACQGTIRDDKKEETKRQLYKCVRGYFQEQRQEIGKSVVRLITRRQRAWQKIENPQERKQRLAVIRNGRDLMGDQMKFLRIECSELMTAVKQM